MLPKLKKINFKEYDLYIRQNGSEIKVPDKINTVLQLKEFCYKQNGPKTYQVYFSKKGSTIDEGKKPVVVNEKSNPLKFKISDERIEKKEIEIKKENDMPDFTKEYYELREKINDQKHTIDALQKELYQIKSELHAENEKLRHDLFSEIALLQECIDDIPDSNPVPVEDPITSYKPLLDLLPLFISATNKNNGTDYNPAEVQDYLKNNPEKLKELVEKINTVKKVETSTPGFPGAMPV